MDPFSDQRKKVQILQSIFPDAQEEVNLMIGPIPFMYSLKTIN